MDQFQNKISLKDWDFCVGVIIVLKLFSLQFTNEILSLDCNKIILITKPPAHQLSIIRDLLSRHFHNSTIVCLLKRDQFPVLTNIF